jgi:non-heme chloroperoxidase
MPYISTRDNQQLYLKDWGGGRPVILIHGWPLSADSWDDVAVALAQSGFRTIAYDRRGFGRSDQPWDGYDYNTFADDLAAVIDATNARDATLVGFSMGGGEVARYMSRHSGRNVARAALIGSVVPFLLKTDTNPGGVDRAVFDQIIAGIQKDRPHFFANFFKAFFGAGAISSPVSDEVIEWARDTALDASLRATLECVVAFAGTDFRHDLAAFKVPTLIIHGTADQIVPIDISSRVAAQGIANAKLIEYDGAPHGLFATHKDRLIADLLAFLKG